MHFYVVFYKKVQSADKVTVVKNTLVRKCPKVLYLSVFSVLQKRFYGLKNRIKSIDYAASFTSSEDYSYSYNLQLIVISKMKIETVILEKNELLAECTLVAAGNSVCALFDVCIDFLL